MTSFLIAAIFNLPVSAVTFPPKACAPAFVRQWNTDRAAAWRRLPARACRMQGETGRYLCDRDGCAREVQS